MTLREPTDAMVQELAAEYVLGEIATDDLGWHALQLMSAGYDNDNLAALAGAERDQSPADLRELFERALRDLGVVLPEPLTAASLVKRQLAGRVLLGEVSPRHAAERMVVLLHKFERELPKCERYVGDSFGIARIVGNYYAYDDTGNDTPEAIATLDDGIRRACE